VLQFLGYERGSKAYRLYNPASSKVVVSRDVVFDEAACWGWESDDGEATPGGLSSSFTIKYMAYSGAGELAHGEAEGTPSSEAEGTPSSEAEGAPSRAAQGAPSSESQGTPSRGGTLERGAGGTLESGTGDTLERGAGDTLESGAGDSDLRRNEHRFVDLLHHSSAERLPEHRRRLLRRATPIPSGG